MCAMKPICLLLLLPAIASPSFFRLGCLYRVLKIELIRIHMAQKPEAKASPDNQPCGPSARTTTLY